MLKEKDGEGSVEGSSSVWSKTKGKDGSWVG